MRNTTLKAWSWRFQKILFGHWPRCLAALGLLLLSSGNLQATTTVTTVGGGSTSKPYSGFIDGNTLTAAMFNMPSGMALDPSGTYLFIADYSNNAVRLVSSVGDTANSVTTTFASATNGAGVSGPLAVTVDSATNVYVLNQGSGNNGAVLHLSGVRMSAGLVLVYPPLATGLVNATAMAMDGYDNLYVTVNGNKIIRVTTNNLVTTIGTVSQVGTSLRGIAVLDNGQLALSDAGNNGIWIMNPITGNSTKLTGFHGAGDVIGTSATAAFNSPQSISKAAGNLLVVADRGNNKVKLVDPTGIVTTLYGVSSNLWVTGPGTFPGWWDGPGTSTKGSAESRQPFGVLVAPDGSLFVTEVYYHILRHVTGTGLAGPQSGFPQMFNALGGIALDPSGSSLYIADSTNNAVQLLNLGNNQTTTFLNSSNAINHPASVLVDTNNTVYVLNQAAGTNGFISEFDGFGNFLGTAVTGLNLPTALTMDGSGNIFIAEQAGSIKVVFPSGASNTIVTINTNIVTLNTNVQLMGIAIFDDGYLAVSDAGNHVIWTVNPMTKLVNKLTGQLGTSGSTLGTSNFAKLFAPRQLARAGNNQLVVADYGNNRLVTATRSGAITNVLVSTNSQVWYGRPIDPFAGGSVAMLFPVGVAVSGTGLIYDSEPTNAAIRGLTQSVAAPPTAPIVTLPYFYEPHGLAYDSIGNILFIADYKNNAVQLLDLNLNLTSTFLTTTEEVTNPASVLVDTNGNIYVLNQGLSGDGYIQEYDIYGNNYGRIVSGLNQPTAFTLDGYGNFIVSEQGGNIRAFGVGVSNTIVTITNAGVSLQGLALFDDGNIAVSDAGNHVIWTVNPITKLITKLTGQLHTNGISVGASNFAKLSAPRELVRVGGNQIVCADYGNNRLVLVQRNGTVITNNTTYHLNSSVANIWFGQNGDPVASGTPKFVWMVQPFGVTIGNGGEIFASETYYEDIRGLTGTGLTSPTFNPGVPLPIYSSLAGIALNNLGDSLFIADPVANTVSKLNLANNQTTVLLDSSSGIYQPVDVGLDSSDNLYVLNQGTGGNGSIWEFDQYGNFIATNAGSLAMPTAMKLTFAGDIYVTELNGAVQKFNASGSNTVATINTNANVQLQGVAVLDNGSVVVSDAGNHVVWKIAPGTSNASLFTGIFGTSGANFGGANAAKLNKPLRLAQAAGGKLMIVDSGNNRIVVADDLGTVSKALNSTNASLWFGLPIDPVSTNSPNFVTMLAPVGIAIGGGAGTNQIVFASENVYKDIRGIMNTGIQAPMPPPPAPLNLVATATYGQVGLTWSSANGATNYNVKRATSTNAGFSVIGSTSANVYTDTNVLGGSIYYYVVSAVNGGGESSDSAIAIATPLIPPPPAPRIGWFDYEGNNQTGFFTVLHPVSIATYNNDQLLAIDPMTNGVTTYYIAGPPPLASQPGPTNGSTPTAYQDKWAYAAPLPVTTVPDTIIRAINVDSIGQVSPITTAEFIFQVANPTIGGNNAAQFTISDLTSNAVFWYTTDGTDPTNEPPSIGPVVSDTNSNPVTLALDASTNLVFKVRAFRPGYLPSGIAAQSFSPGNFHPNTITFGTASGEPHSRFLARPGQFFYAPVTLQLVPNFDKMYSLQFNVSVTNGLAYSVTNLLAYTNTTITLVNGLPVSTNATVSTNQLVIAYSSPAALVTNVWYYNNYIIAITNGGLAYTNTFTVTNYFVYANVRPIPPPIQNGAGIDFFSMLMTQVKPEEGQVYPPADGKWYLPLLPLAQQVFFGVTNLSQTTFVNSNNNLLGVGWLYRTGFKYVDYDIFGNVVLDFDTTKQDLIAFSIAHDTLFAKANGLVVAGAYSFQVPTNSISGDQYFIQLGSPSATKDGVGAPGADIFIQAPAKSQAVTVGSSAYIVGDAAPFHWLNAGDFGNTNLDNSDVMQVYQSAVELVNMPPQNSDLYAAMDSSGGFGAFDSANGYYTNSGPADVLQQQAMWDGNDMTINQMPFGDTNLDINDLYVTFRRSLDPSLIWFKRYWTNGMFVAVTNINYAFNSNTPHLRLGKDATGVKSPIGTPAYINSSVVFSAGDAVAGAGSTIQIPITASVFGSYPLRVLGLNLTVHALDGSPALTQPVAFSPSIALGTPSVSSSRHAANYSAVWLDAGIAGLSNNATIGTLTVTLPAGTTTNSAYAVHFDFGSGSPNGLAVFPNQKFTGLITTTVRTNSNYHDGIPDSWRLRWFGTVNNLLTSSNACPSGDGVNNWKKFIAGVDPNIAGNFPSVNPKTPVPAGSVTAIHWPSVSGKKYAIERATSLFNGPWTILSTNTGTGGDMEFDDPNTANVKFYRVRIVP